MVRSKHAPYKLKRISIFGQKVPNGLLIVIPFPDMTL